MTDTREKVRGLFLAALMVMSVFAGTIAFSGGAAAQAANEDPDIVSAVEYNGNIEVVFSDEVQSIDGNTFDVEVGDESFDASIGSSSNPRYVLTGSWEDLNPTDDVTVTANDVQAGVAGGPTVDEIQEDVDVTSVVMDSSTTANDERSEAASVFAGEVIAVQSQSGSGYEIRDLSDSNAIQGGSLGENATTFAFETEDLDTGNSYRISFDASGANDKFFNITDLGLEASADDVNTEEDLTVDIEATWGNRPVTATLVDEDETREATLNGQGEATVNFGSLDAGNYTVNVTDEQSGIEATTGTIEVVEAGDEDASFGNDAYVAEEVGDVAEIPIELDNTDTADVRIGTRDDGYVINASVTDEGDGEVTLLFNTFTAGSINDSDVDNSDVLAVDTEDESDEITVTNEQGDFANTNAGPNDGLLDPAQYEMVVETNAGDDLGTLDLNDRSTGNMSIWTAPEDDSVSDWGAAGYWNNEGSSVTETDEVATEDFAIHAVEATGLEGAFEYYENDSALLANETLFGLTVEQTNPGPNRDAKELDFGDAATIQPDAANDTYFVSIDLGDATSTPRALQTGDEYEANFTINESQILDTDGDDYAAGEYEVVDRDGSLDTTDGEVFVQAASGQEISGETTIAPGSEVTVRVSSSDADSPFRFNPSATVQPDGTFNVSIDFSDEDTGTNFTASVIDPFTNNAFDDADTVEGQISDEIPATDTPTPSDGDNATETPTDEGDATATPTDGGMTPTPTETPTGPGFGVVLAIFAMLGAALLAARRNA